MASLLYPLLGKFLVVVYVEFGHLDDRPPRNCDNRVKRQVLYQLLFLSLDKKTKHRIEYLYAGNTRQVLHITGMTVLFGVLELGRMAHIITRHVEPHTLETLAVRLVLVITVQHGYDDPLLDVPYQLVYQLVLVPEVAVYSTGAYTGIFGNHSHRSAVEPIGGYQKKRTSQYGRTLVIPV